MRILCDILACLGVALLVVLGIDSGIMASTGALHFGSPHGAPVAVAAQMQVYKPHFRITPQTTTARVVQDKPRAYTVRPGDSLSTISRHMYGAYADWPVIYWHNRGIIHYASLIYVGQHFSIPALPATIPAAPATLAPVEHMVHVTSHTSSASGEDADSGPVSHTSSGGSSVPVAAPPVTLGSYSCSALESLWMAAGGRSGAAFMAAEIAMAESGGNPSAVSPTDDFGLWQINGSHGSMASLNPFRNAQAAVSISSDGTNWSPWTTYTSGAYSGKCSGSAVTTSIIRHVPHPAPVSSRAQIAVAFAYHQIGCRYTWGGTGPCWSGFDCSGLVQAAWRHAGVYIARTTYEQWATLRHISRSELQPGDLVFANGFGHVLIYVGGGYVIHAPHTNSVVQRMPLAYAGAVGYARV